jgi:hypothetical protein
MIYRAVSTRYTFEMPFIASVETERVIFSRPIDVECASSEALKESREKPMRTAAGTAE